VFFREGGNTRVLGGRPGSERKESLERRRGLSKDPSIQLAESKDNKEICGKEALFRKMGRECEISLTY